MVCLPPGRSLGKPIRTVASAFMLIVLAGPMVDRARAEGEPAVEFLQQLRASGLHDQAIAYLDRLNQYPGVDAELISAVALEKAQTHIDSILLARTVAERDRAFDDAMTQLKVFLKQSDHPRISEAQSQLGKLQMVRGAKSLGGDDNQSRNKARANFQEAAGTFDAIIERLKGQLATMQGARIDPSKDPEKAAQRDQYRFEYLEAQANAGEARLSAAQTFPKPEIGGKKLLEEALTRYTDLSEKYETYVQGASAFFPRGRVEQLLGQTDKALESFTRMLEQPDADDLRIPKFGATIGLMQIAMAKDPADFAGAIRHGETFVDSIRPDEKRLPIVQELRLEMARALLAKSRDESQTKAPQRKRAQADARKLLLEAKKMPGDHLPQTEALLAEMGIDSVSEEEVVLPNATEDPKSLQDAIAAGRQLWDSTQAIESQIKTLEGQKAPAGTIDELKASQESSRNDAIILLRRGLGMINPKTDVRQANEARQLLAFFLFGSGQYRDAAVVGQFLAKSAPGTEIGLPGGVIALSSLQNLLAEDASVDRFVQEIESLGYFLQANWPDDPKASQAKSILIRLALSRDEFEKAAGMIEAMPGGAEKSLMQRIQGQLKYQNALKLDDPSQSDALLDSAIADLTTGLTGITGNLVSGEDAQAALFLALAQLRRDQHEAAVQTLDHPKYGPVGLLGKIDAPSESFATDVYRTQLQALVGVMTTTQGDTSTWVDRASKAIDNLRESTQGADGQQRLVATFLRLAAEVREQLDQADAARKGQLIAAFRVFLTRIAESTRDTATLQWVGQTLMEMGESLIPPGSNVAQGEAAELLTTAEKTFDDLRKQPGTPGALAFLQGRSLRLLGKYPQSLEVLESVLKTSPTMLDAQIEAALAYEQWAAVVDPKLSPKVYQAAMSGGRPGANRKNVIWGWGQISKLTLRDKKYADKFFESRYHIALCRYLQGKASSSDAIIAKAASDISSVADLYPELGGPERRGQFDELLKRIQKELGQPVTGLAPLPAKSDTAPAS